MSNEFRVEIVTPGRKMLEAQAKEVYLPAYDGETGILPGHGDFVGLLGTGVLRVNVAGQDRYFMISGGLYAVERGTLTVFAELGEAETEINVERARARLGEIAGILADHSRFKPEDYESLIADQKKNQARAAAGSRNSAV